MVSMRWQALLTVFFLFGACGPGGQPGDDDAGIPADANDSGTDANPSDPGPEDAGADAGPADEGFEDAGIADGGADETEDAGFDAGADDAGPDAGDDGDDGSSDAGDGAGDDSDAGGDEGSDDADDEPFPDPEPDDCVTDVSAGHHEFRCDGIKFDVNVPAQCLTAPCGLICDIPGWGMNAEQTDTNTDMRALGESHGYIVVQPNSGYYPRGDEKVHGFLLRVMAAWHTDPARVHVTGFSMGGCQSWRFICKYADLFASAAPLSCGLVPSGPPCDVSGRESCTFQGDDEPVEQVHVLFAFGYNDGLGDFECAERMRDRVTSVWNMTETGLVSEDSDHTWVRYENTEGTVFEFIGHEYTSDSSLLEGHCYPGSDANYGCGSDNAFHWGESAMQFFIDHPKQ
jgi:hypothetical protein